jgi:hypothetical protein
MDAPDLADLTAMFKTVDFKKVRQIDAALKLAVKERTGEEPQFVSCLLPSTCTVADLERAVQLVNEMYPKE